MKTFIFQPLILIIYDFFIENEISIKLSKIDRKNGPLTRSKYPGGSKFKHSTRGIYITYVP